MLTIFESHIYYPAAWELHMKLMHAKQLQALSNNAGGSAPRSCKAWKLSGQPGYW